MKAERRVIKWIDEYFQKTCATFENDCYVTMNSGRQSTVVGDMLEDERDFSNLSDMERLTLFATCVHDTVLDVLSRH